MKTGLTKRYDLESSFQADAEKLIESMGGYVIKVHVSAHQRKGTPDLTCCYQGRFVAFELKIKDNKPTPIQLNKIRRIQLAGGIAKPVWTLAEIKETLHEISGIQQDS